MATSVPVQKPALKRQLAVIGEAVTDVVVPPKKKRSKKKRYHHTAKMGFFTYHGDLRCQYVLDYFVGTVFKDRGDVLCRVCEEICPKTKRPHVHVVTKAKKKVDTHDPRWADIVGPDGTVYHGEYEMVRSWPKACNYVKKGDDPVFVDNFPPEVEVIDTTRWEDLIDIAKASGLNKAMAHLVEHHPEEFVKRGDQVRRNLALVSVPSKATIPSHFVFLPDHPRITVWKEQFMHDLVLWLKGESGFGKTAYAIDLLTIDDRGPLVVSTLDTLLEFREEIHTGIIFDDFDCRDMSEQSTIHLLDSDLRRDIKVRYKNAHIPAHTPKIFCSNVNIWPSANKQIKRRIFYFPVRSDLRLLEDSSEADKGTAYQPPLSAFMDFPEDTGFVFRD